MENGYLWCTETTDMCDSLHISLIGNFETCSVIRI
jgi:hypothetical protein